ncbi:MAG TPA: ComF family protein [Vicinamibacterales bacterium]|nr:ComF family protein [Vicinamibacterales bacterium]
MGKAEALRLAVSAGNQLLTLAFAPPCAACGDPLDSPVDGCVCRKCWATIEPPPHVDWPSSISVAAAAGDYIGSLRDIVHALKYDGRRSLARPLAARMRTRGSSMLHDADYVVPVPLHPWRHVRRGFNQAADLAKALDLPLVHALWRKRMTTAQSGLSAAARRRNVHGAFALSPLLFRRRRDALLRDRVIVLVDDVRTTGATLSSCAEILLEAGAREVRALTAALRAVDRK